MTALIIFVSVLLGLLLSEAINAVEIETGRAFAFGLVALDATILVLVLFLGGLS